MAYELHPNPLDMISEILDKYRNKIAVLKHDVQCIHGVLLENSIVYIKINKMLVKSLDVSKTSLQNIWEFQLHKSKK